MELPNEPSEETAVQTTQPATARDLVTGEMRQQGACRSGALAKQLGLKKTTVSSIMHGLYMDGYARRLARGLYQLVRLPDDTGPGGENLAAPIPERPEGQTMPAKIIGLLQDAPDQALPFDDLKRSSGFTRQAAGAVLSNLVKRGIVARPRRGFYRLRYVPGPHGDRGEIVMRYITDRPWSRITEIRREADRYIAADTVRKILTRFAEAGKVQKDGFFYALASETRTPSQCRAGRQPIKPSRRRGRTTRIGRPPRTRRALINTLKACTSPHSVEVLAKQVKLSTGAVRSVLTQLVEEGCVRAVKLRADREDMRLVYHYEYIWPDKAKQ